MNGPARGPFRAAQDVLDTETKDTAPPRHTHSRARAWSDARGLAPEALDLGLLADKNSCRPKP